MDNTQPIPGLSAAAKKIGLMEQRAAAAKQILKILADFPELSEQLGIRFDEPVNGNALKIAPPLPFAGAVRIRVRPDAHKKENQPTAFDRIKQLFADRYNAWMTAREIIEALNIEQATVNGCLWKNQDKFEKQDLPGSKKTKQFRLNQEQINKEREDV
jgi:hypothetical protein